MQLSSNTQAHASNQYAFNALSSGTHVAATPKKIFLESHSIVTLYVPIVYVDN